MNVQWIPVISDLDGVAFGVIGSWVGSLIQFKRDRNKSNNEILLLKAEELQRNISRLNSEINSLLTHIGNGTTRHFSGGRPGLRVPAGALWQSDTVSGNCPQKSQDVVFEGLRRSFPIK